MKKVVVSAPGKLHLSGEHAVVYGKPALIASVSQRLTVTIQVVSRQSSVVRNISKIRQGDDYINEVVKLVENRFNTQIKNINLEIKSKIPVGAGMGSSAALAVSLVGALLAWLNKPWNLSLINELAYEAEKFKHVNSSGSDPTIATFGGLLWYRKELDFLKSFLVLSFKIPASFAPFVLVQTGRAETTGDLVSFVGKLKQQKPKAINEAFNEIEQITKGMTQAIHDENETNFRKLIKLNQRLLEKIGVVSELTKKFIGDVENVGGAAKISGAGGRKSGSGIVICSHDRPQIIEKIAQKYGFPTFQTKLGKPGVKTEQAII